MSTLTKMAVLPIRIVDRLAKYDPDLQHIKNLIDADLKRDTILFANMNPVAAHMAYNINQQKLEQEKSAVFKGTTDLQHGESIHTQKPHVSTYPIKERVPIAPKPIAPQPIAPSVPEVQPPDDLPPIPKADEDDENFQDVQEIPPTNQAAEEASVDEENDTVDISDDHSSPENLDISISSQQRYANGKTIKNLLTKVIPDNYLSVDEESGSIVLEGQEIKNANLDAIINFLTTPNAQYVAGSTTILRALLKVPGFDAANLIENSNAITRYRAKYHNKYPSLFTEEELKRVGGGKVIKNFVIVKKLPCNLK